MRPARPRQSNVLRRIAVPPPQQKFSRGRPSSVATEAFHAEAMALARATGTDRAAGNDPAIGGGRAEAQILQRRD